MNDLNVFVEIDNRMKCSSVDLFYISMQNVTELKNYKDIDGFYKIEISFVDGSVIQFEYSSEEDMELDYEVLLGYFEYVNGGPLPDEDSDEDSDSDSDFDSDTTYNNSYIYI